MNILFIINGVGSVGGLPGISGGDVRWIEIAKHWQGEGYNIHVFTPEAGVRLCEKLGLKATFHVHRVPNDYSLKTYMLRFLKSRFVPRSLKDFRGVVYSTTEHVYDVLPALKIKQRCKDNVWVAAIHWVAPLKRRGTSWLNGVLFFFNQRLGFHHIKNGADVILAISENTAEQLKSVGIRKNVFAVCGGVDYEGIRKVASKVRAKKCDAVFMKRFDGTKGVFDVIEIWRDVVRVRRDARLGMVGLGTREVMDKLREMVEAFGIGGNVDFLGPIYDFDAKFSVLASSELFVLPSYEENWGIVIGEAMAAGVPALCYDLHEIRPIWQDNVVWVPKGDKLAFAKEVLSLLDNENWRSELSKKGIDFIKGYSWSKIATREMGLILNSGQMDKMRDVV